MELCLLSEMEYIIAMYWREDVKIWDLCLSNLINDSEIYHGAKEAGIQANKTSYKSQLREILEIK